MRVESRRRPRRTTTVGQPRDAFRVTRTRPDLTSRPLRAQAARTFQGWVQPGPVAVRLWARVRRVSPGPPPAGGAAGTGASSSDLAPRESHRQRHRPLGHPSCGSRGTRSSWEIRGISRSSARQTSQQDALTSSASREISASPRSSAATPSRNIATRSAGAAAASRRHGRGRRLLTSQARRHLPVVVPFRGSERTVDGGQVERRAATDYVLG